MNQKHKTHEAIPQNAAHGEPGNGDELEAAQRQMSALLSAGDAAIDAALSNDSSAFLHANQQRGGQ